MEDEEKSIEEALAEIARLANPWLVPPCGNCGRKRCGGKTKNGNFCPRFEVWFRNAWKNVKNEILEG